MWYILHVRVLYSILSLSKCYNFRCAFSCESVCVFDIYITVKNIRDCLQVSSNALKNNVETIWLILQKNRNGHKYLVLSTLLQVLGSSLAQQSVDTLLNTHEGFTCARPYARVSSF